MNYIFLGVDIMYGEVINGFDFNDLQRAYDGRIPDQYFKKREANHKEAWEQELIASRRRVSGWIKAYREAVNDSQREYAMAFLRNNISSYRKAQLVLKGVKQ